ncbi:MAG: glycosyltransferase family 4 protein, partial [Patescibacteria group bacterium]
MQYLFFLSIFLIALFGTRAMIVLAKHWHFLAIPNERSSHTHPTPKGGGIAIAVAFFFGLIVLKHVGIIPRELFYALFPGGLLIALVSLADDVRHVHFGIRLLFHFLAVSWALFFLGGMNTLYVGFTTLELSWLTNLVPLGMVWIINIYNFMDGIDGLAGAEAVIVGIGGGILLAATGAWDLAFVAWCIAFGSAGFLFWNWAPAKIFMGDVGSTLIGYVFAVLAVATERLHVIPGTVWLLLLGVFVIDATLTTLRRLMRGEAWFNAHHSFGFQKYIERGYAHHTVTAGIIAINFVLLGLSYFVLRIPALILPVL